VKESGDADRSLRYKIHVGGDGALYFHSVQRLSRGKVFRGITFDEWHALVDSWHGEPAFRLVARDTPSQSSPGSSEDSAKGIGPYEKRKVVKLNFPIACGFLSRFAAPAVGTAG
jgi:hypothetical protein